MEYLFLDMDNTIAENTTCDNVDYYPGLYLNKRPIQIVIDAIRHLYPDVTYIVLSKTDGGRDGKTEKIEWLKKYLPEVETAIFISPSESKDEYLKEIFTLYNIDPSKCLLIDDKKSILQQCKLLGINVKYPQQIICDYEESLREQNEK
jgi:5'(3')-deoxyribonucleotidase